MISGKRKIHLLLAFSATLLMQACGTTKPPLDELGAASRALSAAKSAGAPSYAPADFRSASQRFDQAQSAESRHDYDEAARLAREATADSELATARTRLAKAREAVDRLKAENSALDHDLGEHAAPEVQP